MKTKRVIKNGGYECSFLWYGANKYMHFVPFANGWAPPVLDKRGNKVWSHFMVIYLQARKTPLNTLLINFLSKIRKGTWMSKKLIFEMKWIYLGEYGLWGLRLGGDVRTLHVSHLAKRKRKWLFCIKNGEWCDFATDASDYIFASSWLEKRKTAGLSGLVNVLNTFSGSHPGSNDSLGTQPGSHMRESRSMWSTYEF